MARVFSTDPLPSTAPHTPSDSPGDFVGDFRTALDADLATLAPCGEPMVRELRDAVVGSIDTTEVATSPAQAGRIAAEALAAALRLCTEAPESAQRTEARRLLERLDELDAEVEERSADPRAVARTRAAVLVRTALGRRR